MPGRTVEWTVRVVIDGDDHRARAKAVLFTDDAASISATGFARRNPTDRPTALVGDALAAARAMQRLAEKLTHTAWKLMRRPTPATAPVAGFAHPPGPQTDDARTSGRQQSA
jgi:hypothetical protein